MPSFLDSLRVAGRSRNSCHKKTMREARTWMDAAEENKINRKQLLKKPDHYMPPCTSELQSYFIVWASISCDTTASIRAQDEQYFMSGAMWYFFSLQYNIMPHLLHTSCAEECLLAPLWFLLHIYYLSTSSTWTKSLDASLGQNSIICISYRQKKRLSYFLCTIQRASIKGLKSIQLSQIALQCPNL